MFQARKNTALKPLKANGVTAQTSIRKETLSELQQDDDSLKKNLDVKKATKNWVFTLKMKTVIVFFKNLETELRDWPIIGNKLC